MDERGSAPKLKTRHNTAIVFKSPEMVKHESLYALRKKQLEKISKHNLGICIRDCTPSAVPVTRSRKTQRKKLKVQSLPWLGIGFEKRETGPVSSSRYRLTEESQLSLPAHPVPMDSKDVQVDLFEDRPYRVAIPMKTVLVGESIPVAKCVSSNYDYRYFLESLKRTKTISNTIQEPRPTMTQCPSVFDTSIIESEKEVVTMKDAVAQPDGDMRKQGSLLRRIYSRLSTGSGVIPPATFQIRVNAAPRSKSAFSMSRVKRRKEQGEKHVHCTDLTPVRHSETTTTTTHPDPASEANDVRSSSDPMIEFRLHNCPPYRIPIEFNLFRKVKNQSRARLRALL